MRMALSTWDGHSIQDTSYKATFPVGVGNGMATATANFIDMGQGDPVLGGKTLAGTLFTFQVQCLGTSDATLESQRNTLCGWFKPNDFTLRKLVGLDKDNSDKDWYLEGYPVSAPLLVPNAINLYNITIALSTPYWIENDLNTNTWSVTADTETEIMANVGNVAALPKFAITPIQAKASNDLKYKTFYAIHTSGYGATKLPVDITAGVLDTATLIGAGKMQADGDDLGVSINGVYVDRWFGGGGINSATTGVWVNMNFTPAPTMTLSVALNDSTTPATLKAVYTLTGGTSAEGSIQLPQNSTLQIGTELITYSSYTVDSATKTITFVPVLRAAKGSTIAAHLVGVSVYWIENEVWLTYGNASMAARVVNDDNKPAFDLATSTNSSWAYLTFGDQSKRLQSGLPQPGMGLNSTGARPGDTVNPGIYTGTQMTSATPATDIGMIITSYLQGNQIYIQSLTYWWAFIHPGYISNIACNGLRYRSASVGGGLALVGPYLDKNGATIIGTVYYTFPAATDPATWEAITADVAIAVPAPWVVFRLQGYLDTSFPCPYAAAELSDAVITISDPPTITIATTIAGVEQTNYKLSGTLKNNTTGDTIVFNDIIGKIAQAITVDCDTQEIYSADGKRLRGMISFSGTKRDEWITLESGNNSIIFADTGTVEVTIVTTWRGRNTI